MFSIQAFYWKCKDDFSGTFFDKPALNTTPPHPGPMSGDNPTYTIIDNIYLDHSSHSLIFIKDLLFGKQCARS
jgi:hypothetical protein